MPRPSPLCMNDILREDQNKKQQDFLHNTEEFPCLFNLGKCRLDIGSRKYTGIGLHVLDVPKHMWEFLEEDLNNDSEVSECDKVVWKDNLLTYVYAELGKYEKAFKLNKKIQDQHGRSNLVALVNAAFLFYETDNLREACRILEDIKPLKSQQSFANLKIDAICELGYAFRKLAGAKNLQFSISFLEFALLFRPHDEQIQLMLAIVYRRCCHLNIYSADPKNINRHDFALKAAKSLFKLGTKSENTSFKAAALIELAYLKFNDSQYDGRYYDGQLTILSPEEWSRIVQDRTWKQLCEEALEACEDGPSEKVLKIAGQLYRYNKEDGNFLEKSEQLLTRAIAKKPSNRAHHHLGLTCRKMAVHHEQTFNMRQSNSENTQCTFGGYNRTSRQYTLNRFGNYHQKFTGRQDHIIHEREFNNNPRGGHSSSSVHKIAQEFANSTTKMRHTSRGYHQKGSNYSRELNTQQKKTQQQTQYVTDGYVRNDYYNKYTNRGHHRQGFTSRSDHNNHNIFENSTEGAWGRGRQVLPELSVNNTPKILEKRWNRIVKVPDQFKTFSKDNPHIGKAIHHLQQAVDISCCQNKAALYDLACILFETEDYEKSKEVCKILFKECVSSDTVTNYRIYLVNAYNLYGMCCAKEAEAEMNKFDKEWLADESERNLTLAVRLASYLAATVPELEMCATDLWNAFRTLQKKFKFDGQEDSKEKLYSLFEYISDYRYLEAVDEIFSQYPEELKKMEVIEQCLQRYLNMKEYESISALLLRDFIIPEVKAKLQESKVYKQLMLEVMEGKLEKMYLEGNTEACHADPAWKQLFKDEFITTGNPKKYDIVIVSDVEDYELKRGMMCDIAQHLQQILLEIFGLNVVHAHEEGLPGGMYLNDQLQIIQNSQVSMFVLTDPCIDSLSLASEVAGLRISEGEQSVPESAAISEESNDSCIPEVALTGSQYVNQNSLSPHYEKIINTSMCNFLNNIGATRMILVLPDSLNPEDLPQLVRGCPNITLSPSEIEVLTVTAPGNRNAQCINLMKKIFRAVIGNLQE